MKNTHALFTALTKINKKYAVIGAVIIVAIIGAILLRSLATTDNKNTKQEMKSKELVSLAFDTPTATVGVGSEVVIPIRVENRGIRHEEGQFISAADIAISYPPDMLELISIKMPDENPLMTVELQSNQIDNKQGEAAFTYGVSPDPAQFKELPGMLALLTFKTKNAGTANLSFIKAQVAVTQVTGDVGKGERATLVIE